MALTRKQIFDLSVTGSLDVIRETIGNLEPSQKAELPVELRETKELLLRLIDIHEAWLLRETTYLSS